MPLHEQPSRPAARIPLETLVEELRRRREAAARLQGGATHFREECHLFLSYAEEQGLFLAEPPAELGRQPDEEGNEHQVWFLPASASFLKVTLPDFFGLLVIHRPDEEPRASPIAYLERWHLHNELFGDDAHFLGALRTEEGIRLLLRQPAIVGQPATLEQIDRFFTETGWQRFLVEGNIAYYDSKRHVVISDTHRGNIILTSDNLLVPIDLRVQELSDSLRDAVARLCR